MSTVSHSFDPSTSQLIDDQQSRPVHVDDITAQQLEQDAEYAARQIDLAGVEHELAEHAAYEAMTNLRRLFGEAAMESLVELVNDRFDAERQLADERRIHRDTQESFAQLWA